MPRPLGPSEYDALRKEFGATTDNFNQFFVRDNSGGILVKDEVDPRARDSGSLQNTLPPEGAGAGAGFAGQVDELTAMQIMLRESTNLALKGAQAGGTETLLKGFEAQGVTPERVSGDFIGNIVNFVESNTAPQIQSQYELMSQVVTGIAQRKQELKNDAKNQIDRMVADGTWNDMDDTQRKELWESAGYVGAPPKTSNTEFTHITDADGNVWNVQYDARTGEILSKQNFGTIGSVKRTGSGKEEDDKEIQKTISSLKDDILNPKKVGIDRQIAASGEERSDPENYVNRETLYSKLVTKYGDQVDSSYIRELVDQAYRDKSGEGNEQPPADKYFRDSYGV